MSGNDPRSDAGPEFSRPVSAHDLGAQRRQQMIEAEPNERQSLVRRFDLLTLDRLTAALELKRDPAGIRITGQVHASGAQPCVTSGEPVPFLITEPIALLLVETPPEGSEIELADADLDSEILTGDTIDLGEIAAQTFALALDPYPRAVGVVPGVISEAEAKMASNPFSVLKRD